MELSERLTLLRKEQGLSQMEVAQALDVSRQAVSRWEVGAAVPSTENLRMISKLYQVSFDYLVMGTEPQPTQPPQPEPPQPEPTQETNKFSLREKIMLAITLVSVTLALIGLLTAGTILNTVVKENRPIPMDELPTYASDTYPEITVDMIPMS